MHAGIILDANLYLLYMLNYAITNGQQAYKRLSSYMLFKVDVLIFNSTEPTLPGDCPSDVRICLQNGIWTGNEPGCILVSKEILK